MRLSPGPGLAAQELLGVRDVSLVGTVAGVARHPDSPAGPSEDPS
jgi:hypothetical protein